MIDLSCQICGQPAHGHHFGAVTCRACAAFFRRYHVSKKELYKCHHLQQRCIPGFDKKWNCKKCRLEKCLSLGMSAKNIQYNRDLFSSSESFSKRKHLPAILNETIPTTLETLFGQPHLVCFLKRELPSNQEIVYVDISKLADRASQILQFEIPLLTGAAIRADHKLSNLEQLEHGLKIYRSSQQEFLLDGSNVTQEGTVSGWETAICAVAKWLNYSDEIRRLPHDIKMELLQCSWLIWIKLERAAMTAQMRVNRQCGKRQFVVSHNSLIDFDRMKVDIKFWTNYKFEELGFMFTPDDTFYDQIVWEIIDVNPDPVEFTFLLCNLCFGLAGKKVQGELLKVTDRLQDLLSNDLHEYYMKQKKLAYAHRLQRLMKINEHFLKIRHRRVEQYYLGSTLNLFRSHFSNEEFFRISC